MKLSDYPIEQIRAAMELRGTKATKIAEELNVSSPAIWKAIKGNSAINLEKLSEKVLAKLQPELNLIHNAVTSHENKSFISSDSIGPEVRMKMMATG